LRQQTHTTYIMRYKAVKVSLNDIKVLCNKKHAQLTLVKTRSHKIQRTAYAYTSGKALSEGARQKT